jgi:hypothetical protein
VDHHHCGIRRVSPPERHDGCDVPILAARHALYLKARERNPAHWSGRTRDWSHIGVVTLDPERDSVVTAHIVRSRRYPLVNAFGTDATVGAMDLFAPSAHGSVWPLCGGPLVAYGVAQVLGIFEKLT